jgi:restriction endonuclease S subunit
MKWNDLPNQAIRSLQSSLKKFSTKSLDELKQLSERFDYKYLLGVLNSSICAKIFNSLRSNSKDINPDVLRKIPIPIINQAQQTEIIHIVDQIITQSTQTTLKQDLDFQIQSFFKGN